MTQHFKLALAWLIAGSIASVMALQWISAAYVDGQYIPVGHDSFYHARRIVDAIGGNFYQFDPSIHAPEGSWLTWPWAYDWLMAAITSGLMHLTGKANAMGVLAYIPPSWVYVNAALLLAITLALDISWLSRLAALSCFALSPLTQQLHAVGMLDHHYVEYTFVLSTLYFGLQWSKTGSRRYALTLGLMLGVAPAFHNGMFVLQVPVLFFLSMLWFRGVRLNAASVKGFCIALFITTLLALLPSEPFWAKQFSFHTHSWFHLYVATCTCLLIYFFQRYGFSRRNLAMAVGLALLLVVPIFSQAGIGMNFIFAKLPYYDTISETQSVYRMAIEQPKDTTEIYSVLIWILPLTIAVSCRTIWCSLEPKTIFLAVMVVFGGVLLLLQFRLHYFGSFAQYLPLLVAWDNWLGRRHGAAAYLRLVAPAIVLVACIPGFWQLFGNIPPGQDFDYALTRSIYGDFAQQCESAPGIVLADHNDGHYISYHTKCKVIADNFILTEQHIRKVRETDRLLGLNANELMRELPAYVRYVYVRRNDNVLIGNDWPTIFRLNQGARKDLLFGPIPDGLTLVAELRFRQLDGQNQPLARLFEVRR